MSGDSAGFFARLFNRRGSARPAAGAPAPLPRAVTGGGAAPDAAAGLEESAQNAANSAGTTPVGTGSDAAKAQTQTPATETVAAPGTDGGSPAPATGPTPETAKTDTEQEPAIASAVGGTGAAPSGSNTVGSAASAHVVTGAVVTVVAVEEHAGLTTLCAALERRFEDEGVRVRAAGHGLMRAAFAGLLENTDVLVLLAPAEPASTAEFQDKLEWLEANGRGALIERTVFVVNYGPNRDEGSLELPADLSRPVVLLPFDAALSLPIRQLWAPRRAARHALNQLVEEIAKILK